jgi:hypothetical protein
MDIHVLILYVYGYTNVQMYNFLVGHTGLYRASYNLIITIMPFVMKRYGTISAILVFEFRGGGVYRSTGHIYKRPAGDEARMFCRSIVGRNRNVGVVAS